MRHVCRRCALALALLGNLFGCGGEEVGPVSLDAATEANPDLDTTTAGEAASPDATVAEEAGGDASSGRDASSGLDASSESAADGCVPKTCADYAGSCGVQGDGCGGVTAMCSCPSGEYCGGGGPGKCGDSVSQCGATACLPTTCSRSGVECGFAGDGCGGLLDCGPCPGSETCDAQGKCIWPADAGPCVPATCGSLGYQCDTVTDGCGNWIDCGTCPVDQYCGGGGLRRCGGTCTVPSSGDGCVLECSSGDAGSCSAASCRASRACGVVPNGCGGLIDCGACPGDAG